MKNLLIIILALNYPQFLTAQKSFDPQLKCFSNTDLLFSSDETYLFTFDPSGLDGKGLVNVFTTMDGINYEKVQKLSLSFQSNFGKSVSVSEDNQKLLVGAYGVDEIGKAYLYEKIEGNYELTRTLSPSIPTERFGWSVAISGDGNTAVIGAPHYKFKEEDGEVFIYDLSKEDTTQTPFVLEPMNEENGFGEQVKINFDGSIIAIGASTSDWKTKCEGSITIYHKDGKQFLPFGNRITLPKDTCSHFATSIDMSHDGMTIASGLSSSKYSALVWNYENGQWNTKGSALPPFGGTRDHSSKIVMDSTGTSIALSKALGEKGGEAMLFKLTGNEWVLQGKAIVNGKEAQFKSSTYSFKHKTMLIKPLLNKNLLGYKWE